MQLREPVRNRRRNNARRTDRTQLRSRVPTRFGASYMSDYEDEFTRSWFKGAKLATDAADRSLNYFLVNVSQSISEWRRKGWIYSADPRGWFQWCCRYYMGLRLPNEDARQINRGRPSTPCTSGADQLRVRRHHLPQAPAAAPALRIRQSQALAENATSLSEQDALEVRARHVLSKLSGFLLPF